MIVPVEQRREREEARVVLTGGTGLLEVAEAPFGLLCLVDNAESGIEVAGEGREGVEPNRANEVTSLVEIGLDELESRPSEVPNCIEDLGVLAGEPGWLSLEVDPAVAEERSALARFGAVKGWRSRGFGLRSP